LLSLVVDVVDVDLRISSARSDESLVLEETNACASVGRQGVEERKVSLHDAVKEEGNNELSTTLLMVSESTQGKEKPPSSRMGSMQEESD